MFPHIPLEAITLDLADTHSISLTVERIISNVIYIPGPDRPTGELTPSQLHAPTDTQLTPSQLHAPTDTQLTLSQPHTPTDTQLTPSQLPTLKTTSPSPSTVEPHTHTHSTPLFEQSHDPTSGNLRKRNVTSTLKDVPATVSNTERDEENAKVVNNSSFAESERLSEGKVNTRPVRIKKVEPFASLVERKEQLLEKARK